MFSDNLLIFDCKKARWEQRTTKGVGWFPHLLTMYDEIGERTDSFDQFIQANIEDPAAPAFKKMALGEILDDSERASIALFIGLTAARSPAMINETQAQYLQKLSEADRDELLGVTKIWCERSGLLFDSKSLDEFLKPSRFGAIWTWTKSMQHRLLQWNWHTVHASHENPFVTSDHPVFAQWDGKADVRFLSFPISSTVALIVYNAGQLRNDHSAAEYVRAINYQTMAKATDFVVSCQDKFPGSDFLSDWQVPQS
jgi:hypothetical protein